MDNVQIKKMCFFSGTSSLISRILKVRHIYTVQWNLWGLHFLFPLHWQRTGGNKEKRNPLVYISFVKSLKPLLFLYISIKSGSGYADEGLQDGDKEREVLILDRKKMTK